MATFKSLYTTSELLNVLNRRSLTHYYWNYTKGEYTFYFVDNRRDFDFENGYIRILSHRSNYFRLRNKLKSHPFVLSLDPRSKSNSCDIYCYTLVPDSVFLNEGSEECLNHLNDVWNGNLIVNVVVI